MATLFSRQKPAARSAAAWWPGGRTTAKATSASPRATASRRWQRGPGRQSGGDQDPGPR